MHYLCAVLGLLAFAVIVSFLVFVFVFKDLALSIVVNKEAFVRDFSSPKYFIVPMVILCAIFCPYYYFLVSSKSVYLDLNKDMFVIGGDAFSNNSVCFKNDVFVYFGLCFSFVEITREGRKFKLPYIARGGVEKAIFWVEHNPSKEGVDVSKNYRDSVGL
ncbi:hypothetical protein GCM10008940_02280 [Microbulbifer agarilyticus]